MSDMALALGPPRMLFLPCLLGLVALACSSDSADMPSPTPTDGAVSPAASAPTDAEPWNEQATWTPTLDELLPCGEPAALFPEDDSEEAPCISALAEEVDPSVADFFGATDKFLFEFDGRPGIDVGRAGAPWFNMGRGELVFLNASPDVIFAAEYVPDTWAIAPQYRDALDDGLITAWFEYWSVESREPEQDGGETFVIAYALQECRACPVVGTLRVSYRFNAHRVLSDTATRSIGAPPPGS